MCVRDRFGFKSGKSSSGAFKHYVRKNELRAYPDSKSWDYFCNYGKTSWCSRKTVDRSK